MPGWPKLVGGKRRSGPTTDLDNSITEVSGRQQQNRFFVIYWDPESYPFNPQGAHKF
jgi:hypothetical protein